MQGQEASALLLAQTRHYFSPISVEFSEDVAGGSKVSSLQEPTEHVHGVRSCWSWHPAAVRAVAQQAQ